MNQTDQAAERALGRSAREGRRGEAQAAADAEDLAGQVQAARDRLRAEREKGAEEKGRLEADAADVRAKAAGSDSPWGSVVCDRVGPAAAAPVAPLLRGAEAKMASSLREGLARAALSAVATASDPEVIAASDGPRPPCSRRPAPTTTDGAAAAASRSARDA